MPVAFQRQNDGSADTQALYAWLSRDADGMEGLIATPVGDMIFPLVFADRERAERMRPLAEQAARMRGFPAALVKFVREKD